MKPLLVLLLSMPCAAAPADDAKQLVAQGRFADAARKFQEALAQDPKNASLHLSLGLAYQSAKSYPEAAASLERAAELAPGKAHAFYSLGLLYEAAAGDPSLLGEQKSAQAKYWRKAREAWQRVVELAKDPKRVETAKQHLARIAEAR
ncbi:MAG: tetratricopeptide repeat protein [Elusimicrobia bacterium]|nr:tetratricopeptide repeat protein [Elusimicrobiota bacterium]